MHGLLAALLLAALFTPSSVSGAEPTDQWLRWYGLQRWQIVFDQDGDGYTTDEEFAFGTNPLDAASRPSLSISATNGLALHLSLTPGAGTELLSTTNFNLWEVVPNLPSPVVPILTLDLPPADPHRFYRLRAGTPPDTDGDCLLDFEELMIYGTNPLLADTDGDGVSDGDEVKVYHTNPTYNSPTGRGAISGKVVLDEDGNPATQNHPGLAGWKVFLDLDFDGQADIDEPSATSSADGSYLISKLDPGLYRVRVETRPGWVQVFPALSPPVSPDGYADRVVSFFDSGTGPIPGPYGKTANPLPGLPVVLNATPEPVPFNTVLGTPPPPPISAPIGAWPHVDWLTLPKDSTITVAFDGEEIVDGPGTDLIILSEAQGPEQAELYLGSTESNLTFAAIIPSDENIAVDLATLSVPQPVRFLKLKALDLLGTFPGFELVGFAAVNYRALPSGHYDVTVVGGQTVSNLNFGVLGSDRPPQVFVSLDNYDLSAGQSALATVTASDDVGITNVSLHVNGTPAVLNASFQAQVTPGTGGLLELSATATDTAGQTDDTLLQIVIRNADGTLPDLSGYGTSSGSGGGGPSLHITSPVAGEILTAPRNVVGTISGSASAVATWRVDYALADLVNPLALADSDPDYVLLNQGTGPVANAVLGTLAGDTLPAGAYLVRVSATDLNGTTAYLGFVLGVRVEPLDIRPDIVITKPTNETTITFVTNILGSITTRQTLREWYVEYAPLSAVNLQNLAGVDTTWTRIAYGTNAVTNGVLATFDATLVPNDSYVLRVSAWNHNGLGWAEPLVLHVAGTAKLGNFGVEYIDVDLPLAGIPITIKRVYNSLNAQRSGDFGYGWSLALQDADIAETIPNTGSGFLSTAFAVGARVYLTAPDGQRIGFTFQPEVGLASFLGTAWRAVFKPDPGIRYTLSVPEGDTPFLTISETGAAALFFLPLPWNPNTYILTDLQGTRYTYEQFGGLIEIADTSGNRVTFNDDAIEHSAGPRVQLVRDASGRLTQIVAPDGQTWSYQYDGAGDLMQMTYPGNIGATFGYTANRPHFLETINDPMRGPSQRTEYDEAGRLTAIIDAAGNRVEQTWDPGSFTGTYTDARGNVTTLTYDARGNLTRRVDPLGGVTTWAYTNINYPDRETAVTDPRGNRTTYTYDTRGNLLLIDRAIARHTTAYTYDADDRILSRVYGTGGRDDFEYDTQGNLTRYTSPVGTWEITYTASGLPSAVLDGVGGSTRLEYDGALAAPSRVIAPDGTVRHYLYDQGGRLTRYTDQIGGVTTLEYDPAGRLVRQIDPSGSESHIAYDSLLAQQPSAVTNRAGRVTRYTYDASGRLLEFTEPGGAITRYEYDADGNRTAVVDAVSNRTGFVYDQLNRVTEETDPLGKKRQFTYDLAGNRTQAVDRNGRKRTFIYDALNRATQERWHDPATDAVLRTIASTYDRLDRVTDLSDPDATLNFTRHAVPDGPMLSARTTYPGRAARTMTYVYDAAGRWIQRNHLATLDVRGTRDVAGHLRVLTGDVNSTNQWRVELWRDARGAVTEQRRFANLSGTLPVGNTVFTHETCGCGLAAIQHRDVANQPLPGATLSFTRDGEGGITGLLDGAKALAFTYDTAAQLTGATSNGVPTESYTYDANGNRLTSHLQPNYTTSPGNRLIGSTHYALAYDDEGNLVTKSNTLTGDVFTFTWDHRNRLTQVLKTNVTLPAGSFVIEHRYDALDRRIAVIRNGQTNWTYYDGAQPIGDYLNNEATPVEVFFSGERLDDLHVVYRRNEGFYWTLTDHLGTVRRVLDKDGVEVAALQYDSYGNLLAATGTQPGAAGRFGFTGRERDSDTGLQFNRARYYDPELGRFISADPIGFASGDPNLYRYVLNRPVQLADPTGFVAASEEGLLDASKTTTIKPTQIAGCSFAAVFGLIGKVLALAAAAVPAGVAAGATAGEYGGLGDSETLELAFGGGLGGAVLSDGYFLAEILRLYAVCFGL